MRCVASFTVAMLLVVQTLHAWEDGDEYSPSDLYSIGRRANRQYQYGDMMRLGKRSDPRSSLATTSDADQSPHPPIYRFKNEKFNLIRALNLNLKKTTSEPPPRPAAVVATGGEGGAKQAPLRSTLRDILRLGRLPHSPQAFLQLLMM